jgi:hypothetical protein
VPDAHAVGVAVKHPTDGHNDELLVIEMSVVVRPFVLDFGGAYLDHAPDYDEAILNQWQREKEEQFEANGAKAVTILTELRSHGIYVADVNPGNIGFVSDEVEKTMER